MLGNLASMAAVLSVASSVSAHIALFDPGMWGFNAPYQSGDPNNIDYNNNLPVDPLRGMDNLSEAQWFGRLFDYPPASGSFMNLPSGGTYVGELGCNRSGTKYRDPSISGPLPEFACDNTGPLHVMNTFNGTVDPTLFGGTVLAITYNSDINSVSPNDFTVISVNQESPWFRETDYAIPAGMPPCPDGGCICMWSWIHQGNKGEGYPDEMYVIPYRCQVTGATNPNNKVVRGSVPVDCTGDPSKCVTGAKTPMYVYQASGNNMPATFNPPNYNDNWGYTNGAQNNIFTANTDPAPTSYIPGTQTATPTATSTSVVLPSGTALPSGWTALGCVVDASSPRALNKGSTVYPNLTISTCVDQCYSQGYQYAGVEYGQECWCGTEVSLTSAPASDCNVPCAGNSGTMCGGPYRLNVFKGPNATPPVTTTVAPVPFPTASLPAGWSSLGCNMDDPNYRALNKGSLTSSSNTVPSCISNCAAQGFPYAGVEYGDECWCGTTANLTLATDNGCNVPCAGDSTDLCGGGYRINVFVNDALLPGSAKPSSTATVVSTTSHSVVPTTISTSSSSVKSSATISIVTTSKATSTSSTTVVSTTSKASSSSSTASVSKVTSSTTSKASTTSSIATSTVTSITSHTTSVQSSSTKAVLTSSSAAPAPSASLPAGWLNLGCQIDNVPRLLDGYNSQTSSITPSACIATCSARGYTYAGVEDGNQCFCGNTITLNPAKDNGCSIPCSGNASQLCGGHYRIQVYKASASCDVAETVTITVPAIARPTALTRRHMLGRRPMAFSKLNW